MYDLWHIYDHNKSGDNTAAKIRALDLGLKSCELGSLCLVNYVVTLMKSFKLHIVTIQFLTGVQSEENVFQVHY